MRNEAAKMNKNQLALFSGGEAVEDSLLLGSFNQNEIVGVAMAGKLKESGIIFYAPFGKEALELLGGNVIGALRNSTVKSEYRNRGIGTALLAERLRWLKKIGCEYGVGLTWLHGKTTQSDQIYKAAGFYQIGPTIPEFFKGLSENTGMHCPYCGYPCLCAAAMFALQL